MFFRNYILLIFKDGQAGKRFIYLKSGPLTNCLMAFCVFLIKLLWILLVLKSAQYSIFYYVTLVCVL